MKNILQHLISQVVENPEKITIEENEENEIINFDVQVAKEDMGRVIGKEGKIIRAIRNVMKIPGMKLNKKIVINLNEGT